MYCPYFMQVTHFLKRKKCKVSLQCVKYVKSKENGKLRSADGPLRTAVAKAIILPLWGITSLSLTASGGANLGEGCRDFVRRQNRGIRKICGGRRLKS